MPPTAVAAVCLRRAGIFAPTFPRGFSRDFIRCVATSVRASAAVGRAVWRAGSSLWPSSARRLPSHGVAMLCSAYSIVLPIYNTPFHHAPANAVRRWIRRERSGGDIWRSSTNLWRPEEASQPLMGLPAVVRARRFRSRCTGSSAPAPGRVQRSAGSGQKPWPGTLGPTTSSRSSTLDGARWPRSSPRCAHPAPYPPSRARSGPACMTDRSRTRAPPSAHLAPSPRPHSSPHLPRPRHAAPHMPSTPPALHARALGPRAR